VRVLELFAGIGGMALGFERAGFTHAGFVEIDPFCRAVLAKHWPEVPIHDDIKTLTVDTIANLVHPKAYGEIKRLEASGDLEGLLGSYPDVRERTFRCGCGRILWSDKAVDAQIPASKGSEVPIEPEIRRDESLPSRDESRRSRPRNAGESYSEGDSHEENPLPGVRGIDGVCRWEECDPSPSPGLQQAAGRDVALSEMSLRVAQGQPCHPEGKEVMPSEAARAAIRTLPRIDVVTGGFP